ncbi:MAG: enoyl-CoA hydratase [Pseudomonadota bacterium]
MSEPVVLLERDGGIATLTLNRPHAMNAVSREMRISIVQKFQELQDDPEIGVLILTGAGRAFCAGLDLKELSEKGMVPDSPDEEMTGRSVINVMHQFDRPIIGAINGVAVTGGFEIALACDILIASTEARFADTHARVGLLPGWCLSQKLSRLIGIGRAKELSLTGNFISAERAAAWGLVNRAVPPHELIPVCRKLAEDILSCVPDTVRKYKHLIDKGYGITLEEGLQLEEKVSSDYAGKVTAKAIASRRTAVQDRGRKDLV